jgi:hypothetical protein
VFFSRLTGVALTVAIGWVPLAPPEHVHESREDEHHHGAVIHRHSEAHGGVHHVANHHDSFDDNDARVLNINFVFVMPATPMVMGVPPVQAAVMLEFPVIRPQRPLVDEVELLIHGPPRAPASLRAPPSFLA